MRALKSVSLLMYASAYMFSMRKLTALSRADCSVNSTQTGSRFLVINVSISRRSSSVKSCSWRGCARVMTAFCRDASDGRRLNVAASTRRCADSFCLGARR